MATVILPHELRNFTAYIDGQPLTGRVVKCQLPDLKLMTEIIQNGGMDGQASADVGMEIMNWSLTLAGVVEETATKFGLANRYGYQLALRGAYRSPQDGTVKAMTVRLRPSVNGLDLSELERGKKHETTISGDVLFYSLEHGGRKIHEIDVLNMTRVIDGVDQLAEERSALGF